MSELQLTVDVLRDQVRRGGWIKLGAHVASQVMSLVTLAILMHWLPAEYFGAYALALPAVAIGRLISRGGLHVAAVQQPTLSEAEAHGIARVTVVLSLGGALLALALNLIVFFMTRNHAFLWASIAFVPLIIAEAMAGVVQSQLERDLRFGPFAIGRVLGQLVGALVAIAAALQGKYILALPAQALTEAFVLVVMFLLLRGRQAIPSNAEPTKLRQMFHFGRQYTASGFAFWAAQNLDTLIIGLFGGPAVLGFYNQAFNLMMKPVLFVTTPVTGVMLPALSRAVPHREEFARQVREFGRIVGLALLPCGVGLMIVGEDVMTVLGGEAWRPAGVLLRLLAPAILAQGFINIAGSGFAAVGRADRLMWASSVLACCLCAGFAMGWWLGGVNGVAIAYSCITLLASGPYLAFCLRAMGVDWRPVLVALRRPAIAAGLMGGIVLLVRFFCLRVEMPEFDRLAIQVVAGIVVYVAIMARAIWAFIAAGKLAR